MGSCFNGNKIVVQDSQKPKFSFQITDPHYRRLWLAVQTNDKANTEKFLDFNDVQEANLYDLDGQTLLHMAAALGHLEMFMILIERTGVKPDLVNNELQTPLHVAVKANQPQIVQFLLSSGVDPNAQDEDGRTPLLVCCINGRQEILQIILDSHLSGHLTDSLEVDLANQQGLSPLNCSCEQGDLQMVKLLVSKGQANLNQADPEGNTPLIIAGKNGFASIVDYLLMKKASAMKQNNRGETILHRTVKANHLIVLETMIALGIDVYSCIEVADNDGCTPIFYALQDMQTLRLIIKSKALQGFGANVNVCDYRGHTPLYHAAYQNNLPAAVHLLEAGAKVDLHNCRIAAENEACASPLHIAVLMGHTEIVNLLIELKADLNLQTVHKRYSVLHLSMMAGRLDQAIEFLQLGADPLLEDHQGNTLLDMVYKHSPDRVEQVQQLLEQQLATKQHKPKDDERIIQGAKSQDIYEQQDRVAADINSLNGNLMEQIEEPDQRITLVFGLQTAICIEQSSWQYKEQALKLIQKQSSKILLASDQQIKSLPFSIASLADAALTAVKVTCRDKVTKVQALSLAIFNTIVQAPKVERDEIAAKKVSRILHQIVPLLMEHAETASAKICLKIQESLVELVYQTHLKGDEVVVNLLYKKLGEEKAYKALVAQLGLLHKLIATFGVQPTPELEMYDEEYYAEEAPLPLLCKQKITDAVYMHLKHPKDDIRKFVTKILAEVQKQTGELTESQFLEYPQVWQSLKTINVVLSGFKEVIQESQSASQIIGKANTKESREQGLKEMLQIEGASEELLQSCFQILIQAFEENNIQVYLIAVDVLLQLMIKYQQTRAFGDSFPHIIQKVILKCTDTNTRIRRRSIEAVSQAWDLTLDSNCPKLACQIIAEALTDPQLQDKAITGRFSLLIQKAQSLESIAQKPIQLLLGKDYDQLSNFACQWASHANQKVRQSALKFIVEICRLNNQDQKGAPFKPRIVSYILGLRSSIRDPLIKKINEVCQTEYIIDEQQQSFQKNVAKHQKGLPSLTQPDQPKLIVLPHSEPLNETQLEQYAILIQVFGLSLITCLFSQSWSSRQASLMKLQEQLANLDPQQRDAMLCEINKGNLPFEVSFRQLINFFTEAMKDPVLKNYICLLDLIKSSLPLMFKNLRIELIRKELQPIVQSVIQKTSDIKQKVREASINFLIQATHSKLETQYVTDLVFLELDSLESKQNQFGNSNMIVSCLNILTQCQLQNRAECGQQYNRVLSKALKHQNPHVRREAEILHKALNQNVQDGHQTFNLQKQTDEKNQVTGGDLSDVLCFGDLTLLKSFNPKQRLEAVLSLKKQFSQKLAQITKQTAEEIAEPICQVLRHLLRDSSLEVYLQSLQILKLAIKELSQHLGQLQIHLMVGQMISVVSLQENMRACVATDKVIINLAKHSCVGSMLIAKEILKGISRGKQQLRLFGLLQLLLDQFSIVLCYQPAFYQQLLQVVAETLLVQDQQPLLKTKAQQVVSFLHQLDSKLLVGGVDQLEFSKRTQIRKIIIELENSKNKGLVQTTAAPVSVLSPEMSSMRDTVSSFQSLRQGLVSPSHMTMTRRLSRDRRPPPQEACQGPQTSQNWLYRKQTQDMQTLPVIKPGAAYRLQGFSKPAGFKRDAYETPTRIQSDRALIENVFQTQRVERVEGIFQTKPIITMKRPYGYQPTLLQRHTSNSFATTTSSIGVKPIKVVHDQQ